LFITTCIEKRCTRPLKITKIFLSSRARYSGSASKNYPRNVPLFYHHPLYPYWKVCKYALILPLPLTFVLESLLVILIFSLILLITLSDSMILNRYNLHSLRPGEVFFNADCNEQLLSPKS